MPTAPPSGYAPETPGTVPIGPPTVNAGEFDASTTLRAEWRLTTSDPDAIALAHESLRAKLAAAGVFGASNPGGPVPTSPYYSSPSSPYGSSRYIASTFDGGFTLSFVARLSDAQRKGAIAAAIAKAKDRGSELAEAAGGRLGKIWSVTSDVNNELTGMATVLGPTTGTVVFPRTNDTEAASPTPDLPEFTVRVSVNYVLVRPTP
jgi:hypothetical protein